MSRIQAASRAVGRLKDRVLKCKDLTAETKPNVYNQYVIIEYVWKRILESALPSHQETQIVPTTTPQIQS